MRFHRLDFPLRGTAVEAEGRWGWRENRKEVVQHIATARLFFYGFDLGRTLHHLYGDAGILGGEMKSPALMTMMRGLYSSLIKLWTS